MPIAPELLDILACPQCKGTLVLVTEASGLACGKCRLLYPIRDDIPVMLVEEALPWESGGQPGDGRS